MKKEETIASLVQLGTSGSYLMNEKTWLSDIDFDKLCSYAGVASDVSPMLFVGAKVSFEEVTVPKEGCVIKREGRKDVTFKNPSGVERKACLDFAIVGLLNEEAYGKVLEKTITKRVKRGRI